jgi:hypothetical protein
MSVADQFLDGLGIGHERLWHPLIPQPVGVPDAVRAVQRTALDVVQAEAALPVFDNLAGSSRQLLDLIPAEQSNANAHPATSYAIQTGIG